MGGGRCYPRSRKHTAGTTRSCGLTKRYGDRIGRRRRPESGRPARRGVRLSRTQRRRQDHYLTGTARPAQTVLRDHQGAGRGAGRVGGSHVDKRFGRVRGFNPFPRAERQPAGSGPVLVLHPLTFPGCENVLCYIDSVRARTTNLAHDTQPSQPTELIPARHCKQRCQHAVERQIT